MDEEANIDIARDLAALFAKKFQDYVPHSLPVPIEWQVKDMTELLKMGASAESIKELLEFCFSGGMTLDPVKSCQDFKFRYNQIAFDYSCFLRPPKPKATHSEPKQSGYKSYKKDSGETDMISGRPAHIQAIIDATHAQFGGKVDYEKYYAESRKKQEDWEKSKGIKK